MLKLKGALVFVVLFFWGCSPSISLRMSRDDLSRTTIDEGVVFGSVQIKVEGKPFRSFFSRSFHDTAWTVKAHNLGKVEIIGGEYSLDVMADGVEVPFIAKLPAGHYHFDYMGSGVSGGMSPMCCIKGCFFVSAGKTSYIGRLVLTLPNYSNTKYFGVGFNIEDAQKEDITLLESEYGDIIANASKELMTEGCGWLRKQGGHVW